MNKEPNINEASLKPGDTETLEDLLARNARYMEGLGPDRREDIGVSAGKLAASEALANPDSDISKRRQVVIGNLGYVSII
jgi:hypothetical protein